MKINKPQGGRCKKAPYTSKTMRVPAELEPDVEILIQRYFDWINDTGSLDGKNPPSFLDKPVMGIEANADKPVMGNNEEGKGILERLKKGEEVTEKEVAELVGVSQKAVNDASKKGNEYFSEWAKAKCGLELQCRDLNAGSLDGKNRKLRYSLALSDKPSC